ncbi:Spy/CpxP family protein refolding chaperone, partial [Paracidovorax anthurii]
MAAPFLQRRIASATAAAAPAPAGAERPHRMPSPEERQARMARHAEALKKKLQLTPAQQPAWETFTAAMRPQGPRPARLDMEGMDRLTTPERIDRMRAVRAQRGAEADRRGEAVKTFYAALNPTQQKVFDDESRRMFGHHHRPGMDGQGPGGKPHPGHGGPRGERAPA